MRALVKLAPGPGHVGLAERERPSPGAGEVIVEVLGAGVCGTDLHIVDDEFATRPPVTMGHEVSGVVTALGEGVETEWLGAGVVCETYFSTCGRCEWCRDGRPNLCPERCSIGSAADGAFAAEIVLPVRNLHRVPRWLDEHAAALVEPLACVCNCLCDPSAVSPGDDVLVTGPGPVGLLAAQVARELGGDVLVVGTDRDAQRLAVAEALRFATAVAGDSQALARYDAHLGADVVIECSGSGAGMTTCLETARRGGRYVQIGLAGHPVTAPLDELCYRELSVRSGNASTPRSWRRALALVERRSVRLEPLVTEVVPLTEWERVFADLRAGRAMKYIFDPRLT